MVSAVKYHLFLKRHAGTATLTMQLPDVGQLTPPRFPLIDVQLTNNWRLDGDPSIDFNTDFVEYWMRTENFRIFQKFTGNPSPLASVEVRALMSSNQDPEIPFDLVPPKHLMAGGLTVEDVQRRIAQYVVHLSLHPHRQTNGFLLRQVHELGLDEKVNAGKEAVAKTWATGRTNLSLAFTNLSKNVEHYREQRRLQALQNQQQQASETEKSSPVSSKSTPLTERWRPC